MRDVFLFACPGDEIGRHEGLKIPCLLLAYGFDSRPGHIERLPRGGLFLLPAKCLFDQSDKGLSDGESLNNLGLKVIL